MHIASKSRIAIKVEVTVHGVNEVFSNGETKPSTGLLFTHIHPFGNLLKGFKCASNFFFTHANARINHPKLNQLPSMIIC